MKNYMFTYFYTVYMYNRWTGSSRHYFHNNHHIHVCDETLKTQALNVIKIQFINSMHL